MDPRHRHIRGPYSPRARALPRCLGTRCRFLFFCFFQAEDGIRDTSVTGGQTCALPICPGLVSKAWVGTLVAFAAEAAGRTSFARPKSRIFTPPSHVRKMFSGFGSRWIMPLA